MTKVDKLIAHDTVKSIIRSTTQIKESEELNLGLEFRLDKTRD